MSKSMGTFLAVVGVSLVFQSSIRAETCKQVDAVTQSTLKLTSSSKACETTAELAFTWKETNGTRKMSYGTSTSYGTDVSTNIAGKSRSTTVKLSNLKPNTTYYFKVDARESSRINYTMKGSFKTQGGTVGVVDNFSAITNNATLINIGNNAVSIPSCSDKSLTIELYSLTGELVMKRAVEVGGQAANVSFNKINGGGTYLCNITGAHTSYKQAIVLTN